MGAACIEALYQSCVDVEPDDRMVGKRSLTRKR
jgi:hypothetical protein